MIQTRWDYSKPSVKDKQQWNELVLEWLALSPRDRHPYHLKSTEHSLLPLTSEQIGRVLAPFQTVHERNAALSAGHYRMSPIWLRTCYAAELADFYRPPNESDNIVGSREILDDEAIYSELAGDWRRIFFRVPSIADVVQIYGDPDLEDVEMLDSDWGEPEEEYQRPVHEAQKQEKGLIYLLDEEALREKVVKVMWLGKCGNCVWDFKVRDLWEFQGPLKRGLSILEIIERYDYTSHPAKWERGALLD